MLIIFQFIKKHIANIITGSRVVFSLPLLFIPLTSAWFYMLYLFCGLSDMIDGTIARKKGAVSKFGANLDTVADFVFMFVCWVKILPLIHIPVWLWVWVTLIALIRIFNIALIAACDYRLKLSEVAENKPKIPASGQTCGQRRKRGLFNSERREEQAQVYIVKKSVG